MFESSPSPSSIPLTLISRRTLLQRALGMLSLATWPGIAGYAATENGRGIAVLYPDIGEPYRTVFTKIIEGVETQTKGKVANYAIGTSFNPQELGADLKKQEVKVVIALGRAGLKAASALDRDIRVVVGGVISLPDVEPRTLAIYSLAPDPALLFSRLKKFMPGMRRVFVVFDQKQNGWLIKLARDQAKPLGLELNALEAQDIKGAVKLYQDIFAQADPKTDSLWLLQDSTTVDDSSVLPLVLQESWNRSLTFFSSNVGHVKRGALFSLYPNNLELGRNMATAAISSLATAGGNGQLKVLPLKDVLLAVNVRTASHLSINLENKQGFDMVFPEP